MTATNLHWPFAAKHPNCAECDREYEPPPVSDSARRAAEEIVQRVYGGDKDEFGELEAVVAAIISKYFAAAPADNDAESVLPELLRVAAMLCQSGSNEPRVVLRFKELKDAQAVHQWLVKLVHQGDR